MAGNGKRCTGRGTITLQLRLNCMSLTPQDLSVITQPDSGRKSFRLMCVLKLCVLPFSETQAYDPVYIDHQVTCHQLLDPVTLVQQLMKKRKTSSRRRTYALVVLTALSLVCTSAFWLVKDQGDEDAEDESEEVRSSTCISLNQRRHDYMACVQDIPLPKEAYVLLRNQTDPTLDCSC